MSEMGSLAASRQGAPFPPLSRFQEFLKADGSLCGQGGRIGPMRL
jgi:hypothetical protein